MTSSSQSHRIRYQPFPDSGPLSGNLNLDRSDLIQRIGVIHGSVYCYIVRTVKHDGERFVQYGCAPNFQGGLITLCACKWRMRAGKTDLNSWRGVWIAGLTGAETGPENRGPLFYLMRIGHAFASHLDLWTWLREYAPEAAEVKAADTHRLGDVYRSANAYEDPYLPSTYISPCRNHVHSGDQRWHKDIDYCAYDRRPALLVGEPQESFLWSEPRVRVPFQMGRGSKIVDLSELLAW